MKRILVLFFIVSFWFGLACTASAVSFEEIPSTGNVYSYDYPDPAGGVYDGRYRSDDIAGSILSIDELKVDHVSIIYDRQNETWVVDSHVDYITVSFGESGHFTVYDVQSVPVLLTYLLQNYNGRANLTIDGWRISAPVPAPVWLLGTGLLGLFSVRRKVKE